VAVVSISLKKSSWALGLLAGTGDSFYWGTFVFKNFCSEWLL